MCRLATAALTIADGLVTVEEGEDQRRQVTQPFYTMQGINPFGSTVSIISILYGIYRLILLLWV
ncbi:unnamed protein product [Staurois parvus]|uniref:Uncharacterized protein n=1 Tax=Staurois parvus TaxID=386267 RepID=A0ABN9DYX6_9NEOB|nr:unnamed protein product [Staurois parvus]